jgi:NADPH-dependent 2,4-dienoyl-CoA reductase/sulfur reductase-like enzyme/nitrite reductase/ring-hydroxylating ferredoxin subunit
MGKGKWKEIIGVVDLKENAPFSTKLGKLEILLIKMDGEIYVYDGQCPHHGAHLKDGVFLNSVIICSRHTARFNVIDGRSISPPSVKDLKNYNVKIEDGKVYIKVPGHESVQKKEKGPKAHSVKKDKAFVIIGAGPAGTSAAMTLRKEGYDGRLLLLTEDFYFPYDRTSLSKGFLFGEKNKQDILLNDEIVYRELGIEILRNYKVIDLNIKQKTISLAHETELPYEKLLIATGGIPRTPTIPGTDLAGLYLLRSLYDAEALSAVLQTVESIIIIGAGFIGLEAAAAIKNRGIDVHIVAPEPIPMAWIFGEKIGRLIQEEYEKSGVRFHLDTYPEEISKRQKGYNLLLSDESSLHADIILAGIGIVPSVVFLSGTGLIINGTLHVNEYFETAADDVYGAGDAVMISYEKTGQTRHIEHWIEAGLQGQYAARAMLGNRRAFNEVPFFWTKMFNNEIQYAGFLGSVKNIVFRGNSNIDKFLVGYFKRGRLEAVAGCGREKEVILLSEIMKKGIPVKIAQFRDRSTDFEGFLQKKKM